MRLAPRGEQPPYARASRPRGRTHWRQARWCSLDFELTGLDPRSDEIISFGAIPIVDGRLQLRGAVSGLVRPEREIAEPSIVVHGIRGVDLGRLWFYERRRRAPARLALADLAHELRLPAEGAHDALSDALTTAQAFIALASHLDAVRRRTVDSLERAGRQLESLRVFETG
jgi:DNA polymerase III epsilon subunit-like protein